VVFQVLEDGEERFWLSGNKASRASRGPTSSVARGERTSIVPVGYGAADE